MKLEETNLKILEFIVKQSYAYTNSIAQMQNGDILTITIKIEKLKNETN